MCLPTYRLKGQECIKDSTGCLTFEADKCTKCGFGMNLVNGVCTGIINCMEYENDPKSCKNCSPGFLTFGVACYVEQGCMGAEQNGACSSCDSAYTLSGYMCV